MKTPIKTLRSSTIALFLCTLTLGFILKFEGVVFYLFLGLLCVVVVCNLIMYFKKQ